MSIKNNGLATLFIIVSLVGSVLMATLVYQVVWRDLSLAAERGNYDRLTRFRETAENNAAAIRLSIARQLNVLYELQDAYTMFNRPLDRQQFHTLSQRIFTRATGIQALEWVPRVSLAQRNRYEVQARANGVSGFSFREIGPDGNPRVAQQRDYYYPSILSNRLLAMKRHSVWIWHRIRHARML